MLLFALFRVQTLVCSSAGEARQEHSEGVHSKLYYIPRYFCLPVWFCSREQNSLPDLKF